MPFLIKPAVSFKGTISLPGDKSISHRALILGALSDGPTRITNLSFNQDCLRTIEILRNLGAKITRKGRAVVIQGRGLGGLRSPARRLYAGDSGTTARLMLGLLSAQGFNSVLDGSRALRKRPMARVVIPLEKMGARFSSKKRLPIRIFGSPLSGITYRMPVASAQVKSAILLAGLYADKKTIVIEKHKSRDHTERILKLFKASRKGINSPGSIAIPGDISSAAFFIAAATILENSRLILKGILINPTRMGFVNALKRMGARIVIKPIKSSKPWEPEGRIEVRTAVALGGISISKKEIPLLIDELPILMVCACFARGRTIIKGAAELRVKETDRVKSMVYNLGNMGADIKSQGDKIIIKGRPLCGGSLKSFGDHRTAMSMIIASLAADSASVIDDIKCINKSFPEFLPILKRLIIR